MNAGTFADTGLKEKQQDSSATLAEEKELDMSVVTKIIVACPAGVGSSAVGASMLRKKVEKENLNVSVTNVAIKALPNDVDIIIITQKKLTEQAKIVAPNAHHISLAHFLDNKLYSSLVADLKAAQ